MDRHTIILSMFPSGEEHGESSFGPSATGSGSISKLSMDFESSSRRDIVEVGDPAVIRYKVCHRSTKLMSDWIELCYH